MGILSGEIRPARPPEAVMTNTNTCSNVCFVLVAHLQGLGFDLEPHAEADHGRIIAAMEQIFVDNVALGPPPAPPTQDWMGEYEDMVRRRMNSVAVFSIAAQVAHTAAVTDTSVAEAMEMFREAVRQVMDSGLF